MLVFNLNSNVYRIISVLNFIIPNILHTGDLRYTERRPDTQGDGEQQRVETR